MTDETPEVPDINELFALMSKYSASDLHLKAGSPPIFRISGKLRNLESPPMSNDQLRVMFPRILTEKQRETLEGRSDLDFSYSLPGVGRFRVNIFRQRGSMSMAARRVNMRIPSFEELNLSEAMRKIASFPKGLVIIAGVTGSGKSTTLAAMVEYINQTRRCHIVTIEDPIEYLYRDNKSFINQREIGIDVDNFREALRYVVRQDPDVILIGEMRDYETFEAGLQAAETGHLVFGTLHASTAPQTIGRILDLFPPDREKQIRESLAFNLKAIVCQMILPAAGGEGLVPSQEILLITPTAQKLIVENKDKKLEDVIRGGAELGMQDFNQSLYKLVKLELIDTKTALEYSSNPEQLQMNLKGIFLGEDRRIVG